MTSSRFDQQVTFLSTGDLVRAARFYGETIGLEEVLDQGICRIFRVAPDAFLGLCSRDEGAAPDGVIITFVTDDVDGWCSTLEARGVTFLSGPRRHESLAIYHAFFRDPDGHLLEVQQFLDPGWPSVSVAE